MHESIQNLLSDSNVISFEVPVFQRAYSWTRENAGQLLEDVEETQESNRKSLLGLLVLIVPENNDCVRQIVDGQQRLTTITLLLSILRSKIFDLPTVSLSQREMNSKFGEIATLQKCLFREDQRGHLMPLLQFHPSTGLHQKFMAGLICTSLDLDNPLLGLSVREQGELSECLISSSTTAEGHLKWMGDRRLFNQTLSKSQNARKNYEELCVLVDKAMDHLPDDSGRLRWLINLSETVRDSLSIIKYETRNFEDAFVLFETLNDRGMAVAASDLIKNFCLQSDLSNVDSIGEVWSEIFQDTLPAASFNPIYFLRTYNNSCMEFVTKKDLFRRYKRVLEGNQISASAWLSTTLRPEAKRFRALNEDLNGLSVQYPDFVNIIFALDSTDSKQWQTIALSALRLIDDFVQSAPIRKRLVVLLHEVFKATVILEAKGLRGSIVEKAFPSFAVKIHACVKLHNEAVIVDELEKLFVSFHQFREDSSLGTQGLCDALTTKDFPNKTAKSILTAIRLADVQHGHRLTKLTIEHVCPQKPDFEHWIAWDPTSHESHVQKLGNLLCLNSSSNSSAGNGNFQAKQDLYGSIQAPDMLETHSELHFSRLSSWTPEIVQERTRQVASRLVQILE